jgi:hypothetical protein
MVGSVFGASAQSPLSLTGSGGPSNCPQATSFLSTVSLDATHAAAMTVLICKMVTNGDWALTDVFYLPALAAAPWVNIVNPGTYNGTVHGSPTCVVDYGCSGVDGSTTVYVDTGFTPNGTQKYTLSSNRIFVWSNTNITPTTGGVAVGSATGGCINGGMLAPKLPSGFAVGSAVTTTRLSSVSAVNSVGGFDIINFYGGYQELFQNGNYLAPGFLTPGTLPANPFAVLACNNNGSISLGDSNQIAAVVVGAAPPSLEMCTAVNQYLTTVNGASKLC